MAKFRTKTGEATSLLYKNEALVGVLYKVVHKQDEDGVVRTTNNAELAWRIEVLLNLFEALPTEFLATLDINDLLNGDLGEWWEEYKQEHGRFGVGA